MHLFHIENLGTGSPDLRAN